MPHLLLALIALLISIDAYSTEATQNQATCSHTKDPIHIDEVWGGARTSFSAVSTEYDVFIAYYDADRWLSVTKFNKCSGNKVKLRLNSRFGGWDSHNNIVMHIDRLGEIHLAANMHATPLVYFRIPAPYSFAEPPVHQSMTGEHEDRVTYPEFIELDSGQLLFGYREGGSGDGSYYLNRLENGKWIKHTSSQIFSSRNLLDSVSAYPTKFVSPGDGYYYVAWVWRDSPSVETNFDVNLAKTRDFIKWESQEGKPISLPFSPGDQSVIRAVPKQSGLINNISLGFTLTRQPVVSFLKFDENGNTQLFHSHFDKNHWVESQASDWGYRWDPRGAGSIPLLIRFSGVRIRNGELSESVFSEKTGNTTFIYDAALHVIGQSKPITAQTPDRFDYAILNPNNISNWDVLQARVQTKVKNVASTMFVYWGVSKISNRDKMHSCLSTDNEAKCVFSLYAYSVD